MKVGQSLNVLSQVCGVSTKGLKKTAAGFRALVFGLFRNSVLKVCSGQQISVPEGFCYLKEAATFGHELMV